MNAVNSSGWMVYC
jgi:hypothetical protein